MFQIKDFELTTTVLSVGVLGLLLNIAGRRNLI